jgi:catechol 2,3-dioxygenase-like lactoylglutathione lyase family enzyme
MLDHVGIAVSSIERSRAFYDQALSPIGITLLWVIGPEQTESGGTALGYGSDGRPISGSATMSASGRGPISRSGSAPDTKSTPSTPPHWQRAGATMAPPA